MIRTLGIDPPQGITVLDIGVRADARFVAAVTLSAPELAVEFDDLLTLYRPDLVAIELVCREEQGRRRGGVFPKRGFGPKMAGNLYESGYEAGQFRDRARVRGYRVVLCGAPEWRAALKAKDDAAVARIVPLRVHGWPAVSNKHVRDAAMVGMFCDMRERIEAAQCARRATP